MPNFFRRWLKLPTISATRAFMGATYTILKELVSTVPSLRRCCPICSSQYQSLEKHEKRIAAICLPRCQVTKASVQAVEWGGAPEQQAEAMS